MRLTPKSLRETTENDILDIERIGNFGDQCSRCNQKLLGAESRQQIYSIPNIKCTYPANILLPTQITALNTVVINTNTPHPSNYFDTTKSFSAYRRLSYSI